MNELTSLADAIFDLMESQGSQFDSSAGSVGEESVAFRNQVGDVRIVQFGTTPAKPKNLKINLKGETNEQATM
jgi:hypothetical protein